MNKQISPTFFTFVMTDVYKNESYVSCLQFSVILKRKVQAPSFSPPVLKRKISAPANLNKMALPSTKKRSFMLCGLEFELGANVQETQDVTNVSVSPASKSLVPEVLHIPICLALISRSPLYTFFKRILTIIYEQVMLSDEGSTIIKNAVQQRNENDNLEESPIIKLMPTLHKCLIQLVHEVPFPPPGKIHVTFPFFDHHLVLGVPNVDDFPVSEVCCYE